MSDETRDNSQNQIEALLGEIGQQGISPSHTPEESPQNTESGKITIPKPETASKDEPQSQGFLSNLWNIFKKPQTKQTIRGANVKYHYQKLEERKKLLSALTILLGIQMFFMNVVVLLIVLWCIFHHDRFREVDSAVLDGILGFTKYYVTAVLVELLSGVLFIVHSVFSEKDSVSDVKK